MPHEPLVCAPFASTLWFQRPPSYWPALHSHQPCGSNVPRATGLHFTHINLVYGAPSEWFCHENHVLMPNKRGNSVKRGVIPPHGETHRALYLQVRGARVSSWLGERHPKTPSFFEIMASKRRFRDKPRRLFRWGDKAGHPQRPLAYPAKCGLHSNKCRQRSRPVGLFHAFLAPSSVFTSHRICWLRPPHQPDTVQSLWLLQIVAGRSIARHSEVLGALLCVS